jgi:L-ascorbate metabolism protein UlaG (beta-lactamase superfamily)
MGLDGVTWFRQAAFRWQGDGPVVYVDPWGVEDDVPADVILITHAHFDHLQPHEIERLRTSSTTIVAPRDVADELTGDVTAIEPGGSVEAGGLKVQAGAGLQHCRGAPGHAPEVERLGGVRVRVRRAELLPRR